MQHIKVFELYSGIGGMHFALKEAEINAKVIRAIDINPVANAVYKLNFPDVILLEKNIQGLCEFDFNDLKIDMITMSPPCQPFTRNGLKKDLIDNRNFSILHVIDMIPKLKTVKFILLENVKGFDTSNIRDKLINALKKSHFNYQEFLLSPEQFAVPNSRLRYYLLAKKEPLKFCFETQGIMLRLPELPKNVTDRLNKINLKYKTLAKGNSCFEVGLIINNEDVELIPEYVLEKYGSLMDIATVKSIRTCCFTKSYGRYVEGTGSVFALTSSEHIEGTLQKIENCQKSSVEYMHLMKSLKLRYFSPKEVSKLMCFPNDFQFPCDLKNVQKYRLLGNSINVHVVSILFIILIS